MSGTNRYLKDTAFATTTNNRLVALENKTANLGTVTEDYQGYVYLNEMRRSGETDDNLALQRAKLVQLDKGFPIFFNPGKGSGTTLDDGIDKFTNQAIATRFRAQAGDYLIDSWSQTSDTTGGGASSASTLLNPNDSGNMWSGMNLIGIRGLSRIRRANINKPYIFTCNPVNTYTTTSVSGEDEQSHVYKSIRFYGITFVSNVQYEGFSEFQAQLQASCVDNLIIENCSVMGHRGDAFQIGSGHATNGKQNRHNRHVTIRDCAFDGANQNNRNPVTVVDCDGFLMDNSHAVQCGKSGRTYTNASQNDFNPNSGTPVPSSLIALQQNILVTTPILRNVSVRNCTSTDGGGAGVALNLNANIDSQTYPTQNIVFRDNTFTRLKTGIISTGAYINGPEYRVKFYGNNVVNCRYPFDLSGLNAIEINSNIFSDCDRNGIIGIDYPIAHVNMFNNTFRRCGYVSYGAFIISGMNGGRIANNIFEDCVFSDFSFKGFNTIKNLTISQNEIINTSTTSPAMVVSMQIYDTYVGGRYVKCDVRGESVHVTYHPSNNLPPYMLVAATPSAALVCNGSRVGAFPTGTSAFANGSIVRGSFDLPRGEVETLRKSGTFTGPSPADRWIPSLLPGGIPYPVVTNSLYNYSAPLANASTGAPPGIALDDNNRFTATLGVESLWRSNGTLTSNLSLGYPWYGFRVAAPSMLTNSVMVGVTTNSDSPENWVNQKLSFGMMRFGVLFESGNMRLVIGGALGSYIPSSVIRPILGTDQVFLNVLVTIAHNTNTGESRIIITHPDTKNEVTVSSSSTAATGQSLFGMMRMFNANEFIRIYL